MGTKTGPNRAGTERSSVLSRAIGRSVVGLLFLTATILLLLWLAGYFEPKIDRQAATHGDAPVLPSAGDRPRVEAILVSVPRIETAVGSVQAVHEMTIASKILARVESMHVSAGAAVAAGDVLAVLESEDLQARLDQAISAVAAARARRDQALREFDRVKEVFASGAANELELNRAQSAFEAAEAELSQAGQSQREAETVLAYATIRAPVGGVVIEKLVQAGDTVGPGQPVVTLYDPTRMQLVATVRESLTQRLRVGNEVDVYIEAIDLQCSGAISEIVPEASAGSRSFLVKVTGPCPEGVYSGMFGRLLIPLEDEQVLVIPAAAVHRVGQIELVEVVVDDRLQRRAVRTGRAMDDVRIEILSGLRAGEVVALRSGEQPGA